MSYQPLESGQPRHIWDAYVDAQVQNNASSMASPPPLPPRGQPASEPAAPGAPPPLPPRSAKSPSYPQQAPAPAYSAAPAPSAPNVQTQYQAPMQQYQLQPAAQEGYPAAQQTQQQPTYPPQQHQYQYQQQHQPAVGYIASAQAFPPQTQPLYSQAQPATTPTYTSTTQPQHAGPILATNVPFSPTPGSDSMFVQTNRPASAQPIQGPHVIITVVTAQFERKEAPSWTRMRVGNDQSWSQWAATRVKDQKEIEQAIWNETFGFPIRNPATDRIQVEVVNRPSQFQLDVTVLGANDILVSRLPPGVQQTLVMPLVERRGRKAGQLTIFVTTHIPPPSSTTTSARDFVRNPIGTLFRSIFSD